LSYSAPISKVIDYLPKNIPRILINRTIVHPPEPVEDEEEHDSQVKHHDFRKNYVFDAYLLGYCDVVTRALGHDLFNTNPLASPVNKDLEEAALLSTLLNSDSTTSAKTSFQAEDWSSIHVPSERVFLFQGAQSNQPITTASTGNNNRAVDITFREIAHCDGCTKRIEGTIQKCIVCFDYDLCATCYPVLSKTHYDGKHHFTPESVPTEF
jgi:Zinc finger, ZZ type